MNVTLKNFQRKYQRLVDFQMLMSLKDIELDKLEDVRKFCTHKFQVPEIERPAQSIKQLIEECHLAYNACECVFREKERIAQLVEHYEKFLRENGIEEFYQQYKNRQSGFAEKPGLELAKSSRPHRGNSPLVYMKCDPKIIKAIGYELTELFADRGDKGVKTAMSYIQTEESGNIEKQEHDLIANRLFDIGQFSFLQNSLLNIMSCATYPHCHEANATGCKGCASARKTDESND